MIIALLIISVFLAYRAEENKRKIGGFWIFLFSMTFSPIIALIISSSSEQLKDNYEFISKAESSKSKRSRMIIGLVLILIGVVITITIHDKTQLDSSIDYSTLYYPSIGLVFLGFYNIFYKKTQQILIQEKKKEVDTSEDKSLSKLKISINENINPLTSIKSEEVYDQTVVYNKLKNSIPLMMIAMDESQKVNFLDIYLQPQHNNPANDNFLKVFPDYNYQAESNLGYLKEKFDHSEFILEHNENDINLNSINIYLQNIDSPQEVFRMFAAIYAVLGDSKKSDIMIRNAIHTWGTNSKNPIQYLHLIKYTKIKIFIYLKDYDQLAENSKSYIDEFTDFYKKNPLYGDLNKRFQELI